MAPAGRTFLALDRDEAEKALVSLGGRAFHARVVRQQVLERGVLDYDEMTSLGAALRTRLAAELPLLAGREIDRSVAADDTTKLLIGLEAGGAVETVHMPARDARRGATICVSTQVGCPVGCPFCASGKAGLERNLAAHEILEQILRARALGPVSRMVVMGIGEPLLNYASLRAALEVANGELGIGARKITVSSVGYPERVRRVAAERPPFQLAISLHTPDDTQRDQLVPTMAGTSIDEVLAGGDAWFERTGREVTYEVCLLGGLNDTPGHAERLVGRLRGRRCTVNLIPYNPIGEPGFERPAPASVNAFHEALTAGGLVATIRWSRGVASDAACGQLRARGAGV